jgi:hypothetical protein
MPAAIFENCPLPLAGIPTTPITFILDLTSFSCAYPHPPREGVSNLFQFVLRERTDPAGHALLENEIDIPDFLRDDGHFIIIPAEKGDDRLEFRQVACLVCIPAQGERPLNVLNKISLQEIIIPRPPCLDVQRNMVDEPAVDEGLQGVRVHAVGVDSHGEPHLLCRACKGKERLLLHGWFAAREYDAGDGKNRTFHHGDDFIDIPEVFAG